MKILWVSEWMVFVLASVEGLGALVHKGELSLRLVEDFFSGIIVVTWLKLSRFVEEEQSSLGRETWAEWVQWLAKGLWRVRGQGR